MLQCTAKKKSSENQRILRLEEIIITHLADNYWFKWERERKKEVGGVKERCIRSISLLRTLDFIINQNPVW